LGIFNHKGNQGLHKVSQSKLQRFKARQLKDVIKGVIYNSSLCVALRFTLSAFVVAFYNS
jgi:hypothetical protein